MTADPDRLLWPREAAAAFRIDTKTLTRAARAGLIACEMTPGGTRRYRESEVCRILGGPVVPLMTLPEVTAAFRVHATTVVRWANEGKVTVRRTPGGQRRYVESEIRALLAGAS